MHRKPPHPLDYRAGEYPYLERENPALLGLLRRHLLRRAEPLRILDVGCGAGANARRLRRLYPDATLVGIEPNRRASVLARQVFDELFEASVQQWLRDPGAAGYAAVILSDVLEHVSDPLDLLRALTEARCLHEATWFVSVPNFAVWYNRLRTLAGRFEYAWSGLYDRTHLRFFTRGSLRRLLEYCGLEVVDESGSPSLVQSTAPLLRLLFGRPLQQGRHLALADSAAYRVYQRLIEPAESAVCQLWPELLGFQLVVAARLAPEVL